MKPMVVAAAFLVGLTMVVGQMEGRLKGESREAGSGASLYSKTHLTAPAYAQQSGKAPSYGDVEAIFTKYHCTVCHGGAEARAGLNLNSYAQLLKGGRSGPVVIPGDSGKSELVRRLKGSSEPRMPYTGPPWLAADEVTTIEAWIAAGAKESK